ncbi:MAG: hypothetical protein J5808_07455 [Paludibacteraceae bacterium]|nr:hypothetical protein [Paludibacteraceae bacterium]
MKNWFYTLIGCGALMFGTTACEEEPALAVGSQWQVTENYYATFIDGEEDEDQRYEMDVEHQTAQYWFILSEEEIVWGSSYAGEYGKYFYDENTKLLKLTYKYNDSEYSEFFEVIEKTADTIVIRKRYDVDYTGEYNAETDSYDITSITEVYEYYKLVKK